MSWCNGKSGFGQSTLDANSGTPQDWRDISEALDKPNMPRVSFTANIQRHVTCEPRTVDATTVREALKAALEGNARAWGYIFDDQGALRQHMVIFVNGQQVLDRRALSDPLAPDAEVYVMQALSGG